MIYNVTETYDDEVRKYSYDDVVGQDPKNIDKVGLRYNAGKAATDLFPPGALLALAGVYGAGAAKYRPNNWRLGMRWGICFGAAIRHIFAFMSGEDHDKETGCHHLAMAAWNCLAVVQYQIDGVGEDDRFKVKE